MDTRNECRWIYWKIILKRRVPMDQIAIIDFHLNYIRWYFCWYCSEYPDSFNLVFRIVGIFVPIVLFPIIRQHSPRIWLHGNNMPINFRTLAFMNFSHNASLSPYCARNLYTNSKYCTKLLKPGLDWKMKTLRKFLSLLGHTY